jgi:pimeloyl-ACP methyl ester carboxylesterase
MKSTQRCFARKAGQMTLAFVSALLTGILILVGVLLAWSYPGKPGPFLDETGNPLADSISERIWVSINGVQQGLFIKSKNVNNSVLLFVHGGPGMPEYWLAQRYPNKLEDHFTVAWWRRNGDRHLVPGYRSRSQRALPLSPLPNYRCACSSWVRYL